MADLAKTDIANLERQNPDFVLEHSEPRCDVIPRYYFRGK